MSYSSEVKTELAGIRNFQCCAKAELSALLHIGGTIEMHKEGMSVSFQSVHNAVIRKVTKLVKDLYQTDVVLWSKKQMKLQKNDLYVLRLESDVNHLVLDLSLLNPTTFDTQDVNESIIKKECCKKSYLRGAFLAGGSINSPETSSYHLEIQTASEKQASILKRLANEFELNAKVSANKRGFIMYLKEAERISDFLRLTGATNQLFEYEDSRIKRDFKNSINRVINCDIANERKALLAANQQLEQIEYIEKHHPNPLPKSIQEAIFLRKKYPEATLLELSFVSKDHFPDLISKSALNHRFRAIKDLVSQLKAGEDHD